ncbi:Na/Pi symporter [Candidatus Latescibacterota bacterium]
MLKVKFWKNTNSLSLAFEFTKVLFFVYGFLLSIDLMATAFKASGEGFAESIMQTTSNPFISLIIGIVVTSVIQSSSTTTSIIVAMVGAGTISLKFAIPMIMGANIGTTVTCTIVSFGYLGRKEEFERAFSAAIVNDVFKIFLTTILFPLEIYTGIIYKSANAGANIFTGMGGMQLVNPLKMIVKPVSHLIAGIVGNPIILIIVALIMLFYSMSKIVSNMKGIVFEKIEKVLNNYLFRNVIISVLFGLVITALVQSSSITTSMVIPLVGAGLLTIEQTFPYTLGADVGTTITAFLAAMTFGIESAIAVAFAHLLFNVIGISIFFPLRWIPIRTAKIIGRFAAHSKRQFIIFILIYISLHFVPIVFALFN